MIEIKNLAKYYGDLAAVDDLSLTIQEGDIFGFISYATCFNQQQG